MCLYEKNKKIRTPAIEKNCVCETDQEPSEIILNFTLILNF